MVSAFASSWPSPPELETPRKKEESLKALKALVRDWDLLGRVGEERERAGGEGVAVRVRVSVEEGGRRKGMQEEMKEEGKTNRETCKRVVMSTYSLH